MAAAFPFPHERSNASTGGGNGGSGSGSGGYSSGGGAVAALMCDVCRGEQQPTTSLSDLRTLPCLHTLCKKCFRSQGANECPLCGYRLAADSTPPVQPASKGSGSSAPFMSSTTSSGQSHISHRADSTSSLFAAAATQDEPHSIIDTSFLIGNLLESASFDDANILNPQASSISGTNSVRSFSTSISSKTPRILSNQQTLQPQSSPMKSFGAVSSSFYDITSSTSRMFSSPQQQQPPQSPILFGGGSSSQQVQQQSRRRFYCSCAEGVEATSRCDDCDDFLCYNCVQAHLRVRVTKEHRLYRLPTTTPAASPTQTQPQQQQQLQQQQQQQMSYSLRALSGVLSSSSSFGSFPTTGIPSTTSSLSFTTSATPAVPPPIALQPTALTSSFLTCSAHRNESMNLFCETCSRTLCRLCATSGVDHAGHQINYVSSADGGGARGRGYVMNLANEIRQFVKNVEDASDVVERMTERVETRVQAVANEVRAVMHHHISALEERKRDLLQRVDAVRAAKVNALCAQRDDLRQHQAKLKNALEQVDALLRQSSSDPDALNKASELVAEQMRYVQNVRPFLQQQEDDRVLFIAPEAPLLTALRSLGAIVTGAFAPNSAVVGDIYRRAIKDKVVVYTVQAKDHVGDACTVGGDHVNVVVQTPDAYHYNGEVSDKKNGTYTCSFKPTMEGKHLVYIFIRAKPIHGSPFSLLVRKGRDYASVGAHPIFSFGGEGTEDGQLCRPWGIACDKQNRIIVADRSNNRVQIFDQNGKFLHKFGSPGCRNGQFDRPAGVAVNSKNQIVVVDKDNHRVQVFTSEGQFLFKFGEKGRSAGQFNYPWDCAVSSDDSIAVSDTRNHRVQLFNATGVYMKKFGFESSLLFKQFDSPRGVVFAPDGRLLVTDFNNHRLVIIDLVHDQLDFVGREGEYESCFRRPQGIDVDLDGAILVADSRNNRVQAFSPQMQFVGAFGLETGPSTRSRTLMDRPCDLCVTPDGRIFVVDFGNNKIHVF